MDKLQAKFDEGKFVCIGLDVDLEKIPDCVVRKSVSGRIFAFNKAIIDATKDLVCAYKPNIAFYEKYGVDGLRALIRTIEYIRKVAPDVVIILDAKRGDIGNTNDGYVSASFGVIDADAITLSPYMGRESLLPFLERADKGCIMLCRTSNPGAGEFQDLEVPLGWHSDSGEIKRGPQYQRVAMNIAGQWNTNGNCMLVVGATAPEELSKVRDLVGDMPLLIPGIGAQGGDLETSYRLGKNSKGQGVVFNNSRKALYASSGPDFPEASRVVVLEANQTLEAAMAA